jgi:multidrug efflux pump subunit AcrA (membrane-fusion protein)
LPIKNRELALIDLPKLDSLAETDAYAAPNVTINSNLYGEHKWQGTIVRSSGYIDNASRQLSVFAKIDPSSHRGNRSTLNIGEYVTATIEGKKIPNAIVVPNKSIYRGTYVYLFDGHSIKRQDITIYWQDENNTIVSDGLKAGDKLIITPLGQIPSGTPAELKNKASTTTTVNPDVEETL